MYFLDLYNGPKTKRPARRWPKNGDMTWKEIGGKFGKDHATAIHAVHLINNLIDTNRTVATKIASYQIQIETILNFEKNIVIDKFIEIKELLKTKVDANNPISFDLIIVYNKLLEKYVNKST